MESQDAKGSVKVEKVHITRQSIIPYIALIAGATVAGHYYLYAENRADKLEMALRIVEEKDRINNDQIRDLMFAVRDVQGEKEGMKGQGYVAGILDAMSRPDHYNAIWHDGYNRGSEVREQIAEAFLKGGLQTKETIVEPPKDTKK